MNNQLPIFFSCDDRYIPFLAVALESLEQNASHEYQYLIKILHTNTISATNQTKIKQKYHHDVFQIEFVDISSAVVHFNNKLHTRDYYSRSTYYRLFIPSLYPQFDKALYLDSDIVVLGDVAQLYKTNLGNNLVGAVTDEFVQTIPEICNYVVNRLGLATDKQYFNAGVLLMNLQRLREIDFESIFINLLSRVTFKVAQDQDYLNVICHNQVKYLANQWDKMPFPNAKIKEQDVKIFHFNLDQKPWQKNGVLFEKYFWQYARQTDFYDMILQRKAAYSPEQQLMAQEQTKKLIEMADMQARDVRENVRIAQIIAHICDFEVDNDADFDACLMGVI